MGQFTGWTFATGNATASEVANIQLRLYQVKATTTRSSKTIRY
jgi:hypothetical protein